MLTQIRNQKGFTLIELMIVVAIIGILAAVAIPAYTDYLKRSKVGEAVNLMAGLKTPIEEYIGSENKFPTSITSDVGGKTSGKYTSIISISGGSATDAIDSAVEWGTYGLVAAMKDVPGDSDAVYGEVSMEYNAKDKMWACTIAGALTTNPLGTGLVPSNCRKAPADQ